MSLNEAQRGLSISKKKNGGGGYNIVVFGASLHKLMRANHMYCPPNSMLVGMT